MLIFVKKNKNKNKKKEPHFMPLLIFHLNCILLLMMKMNKKQFLFHSWKIRTEGQIPLNCLIFFFAVDTLHFDEALIKFRELKMHRIASFCKPASLSRVDDVKTYMPIICAFPVEDEIFETIPQLIRYILISKLKNILIYNSLCNYDIMFFI